MCLVPLIWVSLVGEESSEVSFTCFSKFCEQLYEIPTQLGDSIPSSKISGSSLLSDVFKLISLLPSFFHRLRLVYHLNHVFACQKTFDSSTHIQNRCKMQN